MQPSRDVCAQGRNAVDRALALDQALGEAYALRGTFRAMFDYDWSGAEADFTTALNLEPGSPAVHCAHALWVLMPTLQLEQAEDELARALELDPLSRETHFFMGMLLYFRRQYGRSKEALRIAIDLGGHPMAEWLLGVVEASEGRLDEAISRCEAAADRFGRVPGFMAGLGTLYGWAGRNQGARSILRKLENVAMGAYVSPLCWAWVHMGLGEAEEAFQWLERAVEEHDPQIVHLSAKPMYDNLRNDPRFRELLRRLSLERFVAH
jgi:serine/threonine-protein kinase